jgi:hypothetical protein
MMKNLETRPFYSQIMFVSDEESDIGHDRMPHKK